jgi:cobalt-zinc-cadmium efflux system membrane fusion protein
MDRNRFLALIAAVVLVFGGVYWWLSNAASVEDEPAVEAAATPGLLRVDPGKAQALGIVVQPVQPATLAPLAELPGTIAPPANARVAVPATLPGVVLRTFVIEGQPVARGQALATVQSRDVLTLGADLARADARSAVARASAARLAQLSREGIIAGARADEARALAAEAGADMTEKARILRMVGGHGGSGTYTLTAPIAGRVTRADILAGSPVDGTTAPYLIDAEGPREVTAQVPERLLGVLRPGMAVRIGDATGTVTAVGTALDPATRSATLKAAIPGGPGRVAGGTATIVVLGPAPAGAVSVPAGAVTRIGVDEVVFVTTAEGYAVRRVKTGGGDAASVVILQGLKAGEQVVSQGTSALKALALAE